MIKTIISFIKQIKPHSYIALFLICLISIIIWIFGSYIGLSKVLHRFIFIFILFLSYFIVISLYWYKQKYLKNQHQLPEPKLIRLQIKNKIISAITFLKNSTLSQSKHNASALYALPWYLIIGKPFSGKSTLLHNIKMNISFKTDTNNIIDSNGCFNFDFYFTNEAVFIDTTKVDDKSNDHWRFFLKLLAKFRRKRSLDGIVYVVDFSDIHGADELQIMQLVKSIRDDLDMIAQVLAYHFPIYLVINKMDRMQGFFEFIQGNNVEVNAASWGFNIKNIMKDADHFDEIETQLQILSGEVSHTVMNNLKNFNNILSKIKLLNFLEEFGVYIKVVRKFLFLLSSDNPYQETPHLSGIYFASALYFYGVKELLTKTIVEIKVDTNITRSHFQNKMWINSVTLAVACMAIFGAFGLYSLAYSKNVNLLNQGVLLSSQFESVMRLQNGRDVDELYALYDYYNQLVNYRDSIAWYQRLGLYKGSVLINTIYYLILDKVSKMIIMPVDQEFQVMLQGDVQQWQRDSQLQRQQLRGSYYAVLKAYLMLHFPQLLDVNFVNRIYMTSFESLNNKYTHSSAVQKLSLINFYLQQLKSMNSQQQFKLSTEINYDLVMKARSQLYLSATMINEYAQLRENGITTLGAMSLQDLLNEDHLNLYLSTYRLPKLFTEQGWQQYMFPAIQQLSHVNDQNNDWVISMPLNHLLVEPSISGTSTALSNPQLANQLQQLYFADYIKVWSEFLNNIHMQHFLSLDDAIKQLQNLVILAGEYSHLNQIILQNLKVVSVDNFNDSTEENEYSQSMLGIKSELEPMLLSADASRDARQLANQILLGNANDTPLYHASLIADQNANAIKNTQLKLAYLHVLLLPIQEVWRCMLMLARQDIQQELQNNVLPVYQQKILQKVPFAAKGEDATFEDASQFFHPTTGILWQFINQQLSPFLIMNLNDRHEKTWLDIGIGFTPEFLSQLSFAQDITDGLFDHLGDQNSSNIEIYPEPTPGVDEISLTINGNTVYRYRNEPQHWQLIKWRLQDQNNDMILKVITTNDKTPSIIENNSYWGFFQILRQAEIVQQPDGIYRITWKMKDSKNNIYYINVLIKFLNQAKLYHDVLSEKFKLTNQLFVN